VGSVHKSSPMQHGHLHLLARQRVQCTDHCPHGMGICSCRHASQLQAEELAHQHEHRHLIAQQRTPCRTSPTRHGHLQLSPGERDQRTGARQHSMGNYTCLHVCGFRAQNFANAVWEFTRNTIRTSLLRLCGDILALPSLAVAYLLSGLARRWY